MTRWTDLGPDFIRRILRTTAWVGAVVSLCASVYLGILPAVAWTAGVALGMADLAVLDLLLRELLGRRRPVALVLAFLAKFAGLYAIGAALIFWARLPALALLAGFPLFLGVAVLKIAGRLLLSARWMSSQRRERRRMEEARP